MPNNERQCYSVTLSFIGWAHTQIHPCEGYRYIYLVNPTGMNDITIEKQSMTQACAYFMGYTVNYTTSRGLELGYHFIWFIFSMMNMGWDKVTQSLFINFSTNSLAPWRAGNNFKSIIFKLIIQNSCLGTHCEIALMWMPQNSFDDKSALAQVIAWVHQVTNHYLGQC